ncbi:MAG TPA: VOC family protein [Candidatus Acidoferrales bacterium]|nr:VOC family protein [Candidatus Acidoferrales bacterium]
MKMSVAWFSVSDFDQSKRFYSDVLGLKKAFEVEGWAEFNSGGKDEAAIGISNGTHTAKEHGATIVLRVDDIERERKRLEAAGVKFEGKTEEIPGMVKLAIFRDPSGNRLQLCQVLMQP